MSASEERKLRSLKLIDPRSYWFVQLFSVFNILLGVSLFLYFAKTSDFFIINSVFTYQFWGIAFFSTGVALVVGTIWNRWNIMKTTLLICLFLKLIWLIALIIRQINDSYSNIFLVLFFAALAVCQLIIYIHFPRKVKSSEGSTSNAPTRAY